MKASIDRKVPLFQSSSRTDESIRLLHIDDTYSGCSWHFHPECQLGYVTSGRGKRVVGDSVHPIVPGEVVLLGSNLPHVWHFDHGTEKEPINSLVIHFRDDFLGPDFLQKPEMRRVRLLLARASQGLEFVGPAREEIARRMQALEERQGLDRLLEFLAILDICSQTSDVLTLASTLRQPVAAQLEMERLRTVIDFINQHFDEPLDRERVADIAHMSVGAFSRFFRIQTGGSFHRFVTDVRLSRACELLANKDLSITEIALRSGFSDVSTFNRMFRRLRHMTPRDYRRERLRLCK